MVEVDLKLIKRERLQRKVSFAQQIITAKTQKTISASPHVSPIQGRKDTKIQNVRMGFSILMVSGRRIVVVELIRFRLMITFLKHRFFECMQQYQIRSEPFIHDKCSNVIKKNYAAKRLVALMCIIILINCKPLD